MEKITGGRKIELILIQLLDEYVSHIPEKADKYIVIKKNIVYNFIVKYSPSQAELLDFIDLLYLSEGETYKQIQQRCQSKN